MLIKHINKNIIDVFKNTGWNDWGRFLIRYTPTGTFIKQIKGIPFNKTDFAQVESQFNNQH